jgi:hypothetical protein
MKITKKISLLLLVMITAFACDELDELTEFDITEDFSTTFNLDVPADAPSMTWTKSSTIDIASNTEIQNNLDLIQDVNLNTLTFEIDNYVGEAGIMVTETSLSFGDTIITVADVDLKESDDNNTVTTIGDTAQLNAIADLLQSNSAITATATGAVSGAPVNFDVIINLDVTVTIDVL